ncbi:MAG: hypothetical protein A2V66_01420 [Ignavibacteria bacterium RBG_13_36_8]|nr:MAG: hypothetical protein A2V66_01420 [Ignavibacteria bacterium RBG_13_36_8]
MRNYFTLYKILGVLLILFSLIGFLTVADEFRHMGEFIGVSSILFSGIIMMNAESNFTIFKHISIQWIAFGVLAGIPLGGILLDNMPVGVGTGMVIGILLAFAFGKKKAEKNDK